MVYPAPMGLPSGFRGALLLAISSSLFACASTTSIETGGGAGATTTGTGGRGAGGSGGGGSGGATTSSETTTSTTSSTTGFVAGACPAGSFATGLDLTNQLVCAPLTPFARETINDGCSVYLGWRDGCTDCDLPPTKWGHASPAGCENGAGADDTCTTPTLDGVGVQLFGLNFDGNVNSDDKIHLGFHCPSPDFASAGGPCAQGTYATSIAADGQATCVAASAPVLDHVNKRCGLYFGWRDACDGCTSAPDRWGQVSPLACTLGSGAPSTCTEAPLGDTAVQLFGLSTGGDVDGNDKLYMALHCDDPQAGTTTTKGTCPPGQLITSIAEDGTLGCENPAKVVADYFDAHCTVYFGWRDGCDGCTDPPAKWGRIRHGFCTNDNGVDNTCTQTVLGGKTLEMLGLNTDGDVNGDDKLYVGLRCD